MANEEAIIVKARYRRAVQRGSFSPDEVELEISETFPGTMTPAEIVDVATSQFQVLKSTVLDQLGLKYSLDETTGIIMEAFPDATVVTNTTDRKPRLKPVANEPTSFEEENNYEIDPGQEVEDTPTPTPRPRRNTATKPQSRPAPSSASNRRPAGRKPAAADTDALWQELLDSPDNFFDNRDSKTNPKAPDFRHKTLKENGYNVGLWLNNAPDWFLDEMADEG